VSAGIDVGVKGRPWAFPAAIMVVAVVAAVVVLVGGGPDRVGVAMMLLILIPLLIAIGGGSDAGWQASPTPDVRLWVRLVSYLPALLGQAAVVVLVTWQVIGSVRDGDLVCAVAVVPLAMVIGWRGWRTSLRLRRSTPVS
jgi:hypothetical protein